MYRTWCHVTFCIHSTLSIAKFDTLFSFIMYSCYLWPVLTTEWLPWLQTNWRDSGSERFTLGLETNCIRQLVQILATKTSVRESPVAINGMKFPWQCSCSDLACGCSQDCQWGNLGQLPGRCLMQSVSDTKVNVGWPQCGFIVTNQFLQWQGSL